MRLRFPFHLAVKAGLVACLVGVAPPACAAPQPGDVYREVVWNGPWRNADRWQRVTDPLAPHAGAQVFVPNPINHIDLDDISGTTRVEIYIEQWGGHAGTSGKQVRVNGHDWIEIPVPVAIPGTAGINPCAEGYQYFTYASVAIPLDQLHSGDNTFEFTSGPQVCYNFGWGQWGVYGVTFQLFHDDRQPRTVGRMTAPVSGTTFGDSLELELTGSAAAIASVDFIGRYRDFDFEGNGVYHQWHYNYRYGKISRHLGTVTEPPFRLVWHTDWVPDQDQPVQLLARVRDADGFLYLTEAVTGLQLRRPDRSVRLYEPYDVPGQWQTRVGRAYQNNKVLIPHDLSRAGAAQMILATWSGGHADSIGVNGAQVVRRVGFTHDYSYDELDVPVDLLRTGTNELFTAAGTSHHGIEVLWPGIAVKVQYAGQADASATLGGPSLFSDALASRWTLGETTEVSVDLASSAQPYEGTAAMQLQTGTRSWEINLVRDVPLDVSAYRSIRMAVRLEDVILSNPSVLLLYLGGHFESLLAADRTVGGVDFDRQGWQQVEIPLAEFELNQPFIESLRIRGRVAGQLWIDDLRLVPHPTTHIAAETGSVPMATQLLPNYPNPFNSDTVIGYSLSRDAAVDLGIYNLLGQRVVTLLRSNLPAGTHAVRWDGRDAMGRQLATGLYLARLQTGSQLATRKLLLLR